MLIWHPPLITYTSPATETTPDGSATQTGMGLLVLQELAAVSYASLWHTLGKGPPPMAKIVLPISVAPSPSAAIGRGASVVQTPGVGWEMEIAETVFEPSLETYISKFVKSKTAT